MIGVLRVVPWVFAFVGVALLVGAGVFHNRRIEFLRDAREASGTVLSNVLTPSHKYRNNKGVTKVAPDVYAPQVQFTALDSQTYTFVSPRSTVEPEYAVGATVDVLYVPSAPGEAMLKDFDPWADRFVLAGVGGCFVLVGVAHIVLQRRYERRGAATRRA
jgi:hypothetical protein